MYLVFTGGCTFGGVSVPCIYCRMYCWPNVSTLCLLQDIPLVGLVFLEFTAGCTFGRMCVPCVYCRMLFWPNVCTLCLLQEYLWWG